MEREDVLREGRVITSGMHEFVVIEDLFLGISEHCCNNYIIVLYIIYQTVSAALYNER